MNKLLIFVFAVLILATSAGKLRAKNLLVPNISTLVPGGSLTTGRRLVSVGLSYTAYLGEGTFGVYKGNSNFIPSNSIWMAPITYKGQGPWKLTMQANGDLVLYDSTNYAIWRTGTAGKGVNNRLIMQADGNLVMYDQRNAAIWDSKGFVRQ